MLNAEQKDWFRAIFHPVSSLFYHANIHPNTLTVIGFAFAIVSGWQLASGNFRIGALLLLTGGIFDMLDGEVARRGSRGSRFGAFFDSTIDRYAEIVPYLGLAYAMRFDGLFLLPFVVITGSLMVSYTRARVEGLGEQCAVGWFERPERIVILFLGLMIGGPLLPLALVILAVGSHWTAVQRMLHARKVL